MPTTTEHHNGQHHRYYHKSTGTMTGTTTRHDHFDDMLALIAHTPDRLSADEICSRTMANSGKDWAGIDGGVPAVMDAIKTGWSEGVAAMGKVDMPTVAAARTFKRTRRRGEFGYTIDMDDVRNGNLYRAWTRAERGSATGPRNVTILANVGCNAGIRAEQLMWRGVAYLVLADALTNAGYNVRVIIGTGTAGVNTARTFNTASTCTVKDFDEPLNIDTLATACAMAGVKRYLFHRLQYPDTGEQSYGLGYTDDTVLRDAAERDIKVDSNDMLLFAPSSILDRHAALAWVRQSIKEVTGVDPAE